MGPQEVWRVDGHGVTDSPDRVDNDQVGDAYSVRLLNLDLPGAVIVLTAFAVHRDRGRRGYRPAMLATWICCTDLDRFAETATWFESATWDLPGRGVGLAFATAAAGWFAYDLDTLHRSIASVLGDFSPADPDHLAGLVTGWDGQPFEWAAEA